MISILKKNISEYYTVYIVAFALFLQTLDATIVGVAIPQMALYFQVSPIALKLSITSYLLGVIVFMPVTSYLATRMTAKHIFISALLIFMLGSLFCGVSVNLPMIIVARIVQGMGGACLLPVGRLIILQLYQGERFIRAINLYAAFGLCGMLFGPGLGGLIVYYFSWQWIFFVNIPVVLLGIAVAYRLLPDIDREMRRSFDHIGFILFAVANVLFVALLSLSAEHLFSLLASIMLLAIALLIMIIYVIYSLNCQHALLELRVFQSRNFFIAVVGSMMWRLGVAGLVFIFPLMLQIGLHKTSKEAGLMLIVVGMGIVFAKMVFSRLKCYFSFKQIQLVSNILANTMVLSLAATIEFFPNVILIVIEMFAIGLLVSVNYSGANTLGFIGLKEQHRSSAATLFSIYQNLGICLGVSVAALLLWFFSGGVIHYAISLHVFVITLITCAGLGLLANLPYLFLDAV